MLGAAYTISTVSILHAPSYHLSIYVERLNLLRWSRPITPSELYILRCLAHPFKRMPLRRSDSPHCSSDYYLLWPYVSFLAFLQNAIASSFATPFSLLNGTILARPLFRQILCDIIESSSDLSFLSTFYTKAICRKYNLRRSSMLCSHVDNYANHRSFMVERGKN